MSNYKIIRTFRDDKTWYEQGKIVDLSAEKAERFVTQKLAALVAVKPKVETADKKLGNETATLLDGNKGKKGKK